MRTLPDPDLSLRDASDFILSSPLARRTLENPNPPNLGNFLRDLVQEIYRLSQSCHLAEFTDHGLGHLCSLVERLSEWTAPTGFDSSVKVVELPSFSSEAATILLLATLFHDMGMLSQRPEDLPEIGDIAESRSTMDLSDWVRRTHVTRLEKLLQRLFCESEFQPILNHPVYIRALAVAKAHEKWPWEWNVFSFSEADAGVAAMLAVADLLDEDPLRCDSRTLIQHRFGTALNTAHWIRHGLTRGRVYVNGGSISVKLARPQMTDVQISPVFSALRNHYRLVLLYAEQLGNVGANLVSVTFDPEVGVPIELADELGDWSQLPQFSTQGSLVYHLLTSFMPWALLDRKRLTQEDMSRLSTIGTEPVDLNRFYEIRGTVPPRTPAEIAFEALL